jgi:hypothetical protein
LAAILGIEDALVKAARSRAEAEELDERRKQMKAAMVVHHRGDGCGVAEAQEQAMASLAYKEAADRWIAANYRYREADALAEIKRLAFEAWRTDQATKRAEANIR